MWDLSRSGIKRVSPALAGRYFTTESPGKPRDPSLWVKSLRWLALCGVKWSGLPSRLAPESVRMSPTVCGCNWTEPTSTLDHISLSFSHFVLSWTPRGTHSAILTQWPCGPGREFRCLGQIFPWPVLEALMPLILRHILNDPLESSHQDWAR